MDHGAAGSIPDRLRVAPERSGRMMPRARLPGAATFLELRLRHEKVDRAGIGIDRDPVAVAEKRDRSADGRLRSDMADAQAAGAAGETSVGDEGDASPMPCP